MSGKVKGGGSCQGKDVFQRMNFLFQASSMMAGKNNVLSCYYGNLLKSIGKKAVLRIHPEIKRSICKRCGLMLKPDITSGIKIIKRSELYTFCELKCNKCAYVRNFKINADYNLWLESSDAVVEKCNFNCSVPPKVEKQHQIRVKTKPNKI